jgi:hypothetical protein
MDADYMNNGGAVTFCGWLRSKPKDGDVILAEMQSGPAAFLVESVDPQRDPPDMFFATAIYVGHLEEGQSVADFTADVLSGKIDLQTIKQEAQEMFATVR